MVEILSLAQTSLLILRRTAQNYKAPRRYNMLLQPVGAGVGFSGHYRYLENNYSWRLPKRATSRRNAERRFRVDVERLL